MGRFPSGWGAFTLALAELIGPTGEVYSIDKDRGSLLQQERTMKVQFPQVTTHFMQADFTKPLDVPLLDGLVIANALHFLRRKDEAIQLLGSYLRPAGRFLVVEYNTDRGNHWVPHPFTYGTWESLARQNGLINPQLLATALDGCKVPVREALAQQCKSSPGIYLLPTKARRPI